MSDDEALLSAGRALTGELAVDVLEVQAVQLWRRGRSRDPAVPAADPPQDVGVHLGAVALWRRLVRVLAAAGDPDGGHLRQRFDGDRLEVVIAAVIRLVGRAKQLHRRLQHFVGASAALAALGAGGFELLVVPAGTDAVDEATAGEVL